MNVVITLEETVAKIHIRPTSPLNKAQLALVRNYGDKNVKMNLGSNGDDIVITLNSSEADSGDTPEKSDAAIEKKP